MSRRRPGTDHGAKSAVRMLQVDAELGAATVRVDLGEVTEATSPVVTAARLAVGAVLGQAFAERLLGWDISLTNSYLDVGIPRGNRLLVHASLATEPRQLLHALQSTGLSVLAVNVVVFDSDLAEWAKGRLEWTIRQRLSAAWPVNSP
jgi:hypothetical protein